MCVRVIKRGEHSMNILALLKFFCGGDLSLEREEHTPKGETFGFTQNFPEVLL